MADPYEATTSNASLDSCGGPSNHEERSQERVAEPHFLQPISAGTRWATPALETLEAVVQWCRERRIWIDTVGSVGRHIASAHSADFKSA